MTRREDLGGVAGGPGYADVRTAWVRWRQLKVLFGVVGAQVAVQAVGFAAGILVLRSLTKEEYAIYTIAGSAFGLVTTLSDLGIGSALLALGGPMFSDRLRLGGLIREALALRWTFFSLGSLITTCALFPLLLKAGAIPLYAAGVWTLILLNAASQLTFTVWAVALRLNAQVGQLQVLDLVAAFVRLSCFAAFARGGLNCAVVVALTLVGTLAQVLLARRLARRFVHSRPPKCPDDRGKILKLVGRQAPNAVFYCIYGQASVYVISLFGGAHRIAEYGALSRLAAVLAVVSSLMTSVVLPRFARGRTRSSLARQYCLVVGLFLIGSLGCSTLGLVFPDQLTWILGAKYRASGHDVFWILTATLINGFVGLVWSMNAARGWVRWAWLSIPMIVACQLVAAAFLDLSSIAGAAKFASLPLLAGLVVLLPIAFFSIIETPREVAV